MAVVNRTLDPSEQKEIFQAALGVQVTGVSTLVAVIPYPCVPSKIVIGALGLSGAPAAQLLVSRRVEAGFTTLGTLMGAQLVPNIAATLANSMTFSPTFSFQAYDVVTLSTSVANTASAQSIVELVVQKTQDIVSTFGSQT